MDSFIPVNKGFEDLLWRLIMFGTSFFDVKQVTPGSPAHLAGFLPSDVVIKFDGKPVQSITEVLGHPIIFLLLYLFICT